MFSSDPLPGRLVIRSPGATLDVLDAWREPLDGSGAIGELSLEVPPGPYQVSARIAGTENTRLVVVRPGATTQVDVVPVAFDAAAPVEGTRTANETHGMLASILTTTTTEERTTVAPSRSCSLVLILRGLRDRVMAPLPNTDAPFELFNQRGRLVPLPTPTPEPHGHGRALGWAVPLSPGGYRLRWARASEQAIEHGVWLSPGWQTLLFVPQGARGPSLPEMSIHLLRVGESWDRYSEGWLAAETALAALRGTTASAIDPRSADFITNADNPMLALLTLHILGRARRAGILGDDTDNQSWTRRSADGIRQLRQSLGPHPDVAALAEQWPRGSGEQRPATPWPPLLAPSLDLLLAADERTPGVIPARSLTEAVSGQRYASSPWLLWNPEGLPLKVEFSELTEPHPPGGGVHTDQPQLAAEPRPTAALPRPVAAERVEDLVRGAAHVLQLPDAKAVAQRLGTPEIARRLGMTRRLVEIYLDIPLKLEEIQGNILAGFNKNYASFLFFALPADQAQARAWLAELVDQVATAEEVEQFNDLFRAIRRRRGREGVVEATWMNLAFTHEGLGKLGVDESELGLFPEEFREGMRKRKEIIGDVGDNDPDRWPNDLGKKTIHALMIVAADSVEDLNREIQNFVRHAASHEVSLVFQQDGMTRPDAPGHEHFGFKVGISQPAIRGLTASFYPEGSDRADPSQDVIAGGEFVLGYPLQEPPGPDDDPLSPQPEWTQDGSYLVFRRLRQDVKGFQDFLSREAAKLGTTVDLFGAKLVGRYRSGAPLVGAENAPEDPSTTKPDVLEKAKINAFGYSTDPHGTQVPRAAHIRKTYPRDQPASKSEPGKRPRILRRGIPFGQSFRDGNPPYSPFGADPRFPNDRGLCFVCYQRSIRDQFELIQRGWVNQETVPEKGDGVDPVASQASPERTIRVPGIADDPLHLPQQWVTTTGGEYFFSPSISALERLSF